MSIWISRLRFFLAVGTSLILAACLGELESEESIGFRSQPDAVERPSVPVLEEVSLFQGNVIVAGPRGYCIDRQSVRRGVDGAVVLLASCESLTGKVGASVDLAVMTVTVLPRRFGATQPSAADLEALAAPAKSLSSDDGDGISIVQLSEGGNALLPDGDPRYWRAGMLINGHLVGLAVYGPDGSAIAGRQGRQLLLNLAERLRDESPVKEFTPE